LRLWWGSGGASRDGRDHWSDRGVGEDSRGDDGRLSPKGLGRVVGVIGLIAAAEVRG